MNEFYKEAIEKLNKKPDGLGVKASAMYSAVMSALLEWKQGVVDV